MAMKLTRDDLRLWAGIIGGVVVGVSAHFDLFPWIPKDVQNWLELAAFAISVVSGKLAVSPLPADPKKAARARARGRLPVWLLAALLPLGLVAQGCASAPARHQATVASGVVYEALATMQDVERTLYTSGQIKPADHQKFALELVKALEAGRAFNRAVQAWPVGQPTPNEVKLLSDRVVAATEAAMRALPLGTPRDAIAVRVMAVERAIITLLLTK
jgi:hypothetical protein